MLRSFTLFCFAAAFAFSAAFAQEGAGTEKIKTTPEILALFNESFQTLSQLEPNQRASAYFRLLGFAAFFEDNTPAKKIVESLLTLAPAVEPEELRNRLYENVAYALCDLEEYSEAVAALNRIAPSADQYARQQNLAVKIIIAQENDMTLKPFDTSALLRLAIGGAREAQDTSSEALSRTFFGRELARQGKKEEAAAVFAGAIEVARRLEDVMEQAEIFGVILKSQTWYDQVAGALAALNTIADPGAKRFVSHALIDALIFHEKYNDAENLLKTLPADQARDMLLFNLVVGWLKSITDEKIGELVSLISASDQQAMFLQEVVMQLVREDRKDVANQVAKRFANAAEARAALFLGELRRLMDEHKFTEAMQLIDNSEEDVELQQTIKRQVLMIQYNESPDETVAQQFMETYTNEETIFVAELKNDAKQAVDLPDFDARMELLMEVFQEQARYLDIIGQKQTLKLISEQLDNETAPVRIIQYRLLLAQFLAVLHDKSGVKENLGKLMQTLSSVRNLQELKDLSPKPQQADAPAVTAEGRIRLDLPVEGVQAVNESAIRDQLFQVCVMMVDTLANADAPVEARAALEKAKEFARQESDALQKAEKLLLLAQLLAEQ